MNPILTCAAVCLMAAVVYGQGETNSYSYGHGDNGYGGSGGSGSGDSYSYGHGQDGSSSGGGGSYGIPDPQMSGMVNSYAGPDGFRYNGPNGYHYMKQTPNGMSSGSSYSHSSGDN